MTLYRIRWNLWQMNGHSAEEVTHEVKKMLKDHPEKFFTVENANQFNSRRPLWRRLLFGE